MTLFLKNFSIHTIDGHISTLFLSVYPDKILILDGGCRCDVQRIEHYITRILNRRMPSVKCVVASHAHPDHAGGASVIRRKYTTPLAAPRTINHWYKGPWGYIQHKVDTLLAYHVARVSGKPLGNLIFDRYVTIDHPLDDGAVLPGFEDWKVIHSPGHTTHDIILYNEGAKLLYAADVMLCVNGKYRLPFPVPMEVPIYDTLQRIAGLDVKTLLMAHGGIKEVQGMDGITHFLLKQLERRLPPSLAKLQSLGSFAPEIRKENKKRKKHTLYI